MKRADRYRLLIDGTEAVFSWATYDEAQQAASIACDEAPHAEVRIRKPDVVVQRARACGDGSA